MRATCKLRSNLFVAALAVVISACGGSGGGGSPPPPSAPPPQQVSPALTSQPGSRAAAVGTSVQFSTSASGTAPLSYQWRRNGVNIAGATANAYTLAAAALTDNDTRYSVAVSNGAGQVISNEARLNVHPTPALLPACNPATAPYASVRDQTAVVGKAAAVGLIGCNDRLDRFQWTQTAGPGVSLIAAKSKVASFEPPAVGTYAFRVDFTTQAGAPQTTNLTLDATAAVAGLSSVTARVDHAIRRGGNASVRAWPTLVSGDAVQSVTWEQTVGPPVILDTSDPLRPLFVAPTVVSDAGLAFKVTLRTTAGTVDSDAVIVVVEDHPQAPENSDPHIFSGLHVSRVYPYRATSPFGSALQRCVYDPNLQYAGAGKNTCTMATLPFLHQTTSGALPTVAEVMDRVLVSHDWQGEVFEQFLNTNDASGDIRRLLNGVTAVVIGANVRPSFYYALTGAIYLDADNFWLTPAQRDVINETPDFRSDFDRDLGYSGLWRYVRGNTNVFLAFPTNSRISRSVAYLLDETGWLMYHELGHANDFLPTSVRGALNPAQTVWDSIGPRFAARQLPSDTLTSTFPLLSQQNLALAQVKFQIGPQPAGSTVGGTYNNVNYNFPYATLTGYTPTQVGGFFAADRAGDEYNYSSTREDIAMLFEEFMMFHRHGIRRDVAITDKITAATTGNTLFVRWGQRGRSGEPAIKQRLQGIVSDLGPWVLTADANAVTNLPAPIPMRAGESWNANLVLPAPPPNGVSPFAARQFDPLTDAMLLERAMRRPPWLVTAPAQAKSSRWGLHGPKLPGER